VRFLLDRNVGRRVAEALRQDGHDVLDLGATTDDPGDLAILRWAVAERRVLVTLDKDFGTLIFAQAEAHTGVLRLADLRSEDRLRLLLHVIAELGDALAAGAFVTADANRIRIARRR